MRSIIKLVNGCKYYKKNNKIIKAIDNINLEFENSKIYMIMGSSGSGKTTLIQNIGLVDTLTSGQLYINGTNVSLFNDLQKSEIRKKELGFVFQSYYLNPLLTAIENVMLPMHLNKHMKMFDKKEKAKNLLKTVGLEERAFHFPNEMSGGEQQRVAIARALANDPNIILADEPTGNLDRENEAIILDILKELRRLGKCIIIVTHNEEITKYADEILYMKKGILGDLGE